MPRIEYDPESYNDDSPTFEPNRARRRRRFQKERQEEKPENQEKRKR